MLFERTVLTDKPFDEAMSAIEKKAGEHLSVVVARSLGRFPLRTASYLAPGAV